MLMSYNMPDVSWSISLIQTEVSQQPAYRMDNHYILNRHSWFPED